MPIASNNLVFVDKILDAVHGFIGLTEVEKRIERLPIFKRLCDIAQLGLIYRIFPGARHSRYIHSLGVMHIADKIAIALGENTFFRQFIRLAGMLHDIGHYPFSHNVEQVYREFKDNKKFASTYPSSRKEAMNFLTSPKSDDMNAEYKQQLDEKPRDSLHHEAIGRYIIANNKKLHNVIIDCFLLIPEHSNDINQQRTLNQHFITDYKSINDRRGTSGKEQFPLTNINNDNWQNNKVLDEICGRLCDDIGCVICGEIEAEASINELGQRLSLAVQIIHSEMDADNLDYLLHDATFSGTTYGIMDIDMLISTYQKRKFKISENTDGKEHILLGIDEKGANFADQFFINRYMAYSNVIHNKYSSVLGGMVMHCVMNLLAYGKYNDFMPSPKTDGSGKDGVRKWIDELNNDNNKYLLFTDSTILYMLNTISLENKKIFENTKNVFKQFRDCLALNCKKNYQIMEINSKDMDAKLNSVILAENLHFSDNEEAWFSYRFEHKCITDQIPKSMFDKILKRKINNGASPVEIEKQKADRACYGIPVFSKDEEPGLISLENVKLIVDKEESMLKRMIGMQYSFFRKYDMNPA